MENQFDQPTAPPTGNSFSTPWDYRLQFKSGKVAEVFAAQATPDQVKAGFSYYDKDAGQNFKLESFTCIVVKVLAGVSGVTKDGDHYQNWYSNLVNDTRTDVLQVRVQGSDKIQYQGLYSQFKDQLPQGVGFSLVFLIYCLENKKYFALSLPVGLQEHLKNVIATTTHSKASKVSLFGLCDLSSQYWGFRFTGNMIKVNKEGQPYAGKGEMYFMPECSCFTINKKPETADWFELLSAANEAANEYVSKSQDNIWKSTAGSAPKVAQKGDELFPGLNDVVSSNAFEVQVPADAATDDLPF